MSASRASEFSGAGPANVTQPEAAHRSGVFAKTRSDASGGWGLVLVDLRDDPRTLALASGAVVGSASPDARLDGAGVAPEHVRVEVRSDGCYFEDLGAPEGTFVGGVRAQRIDVAHGDVVRLGQQLAVFVERDLAAYAGPIERSGALVHGPRLRAQVLGPAFELADAGARVCLEGGPGVGKRSIGRLAAARREGAGPLVVVDGSEDAPAVPSGASPATWLVLHADRLGRPVQLEIAQAASRGGASIIATTEKPLDAAVADGQVAPWFAALFAGKRIVVPALDERREDVLAIVHDVARRHRIAADRLTPRFLEALLRSGWPGGVPELEAVLVAARAAAPHDGPLEVGAILARLSRPAQSKPSPPPLTDPTLARARMGDALARANGSVASAARALGMSRQAVYREGERLGLDISRRTPSRG